MSSETIPRRFEVYSSNRVEALFDRLVEVVSDPLPSPFDPETILVQSKGLERWLAARLAERFGVWANGSFPFPNAMMRRVFETVLGPSPERSLYSPDVLAWRVLRLLSRRPGRKGFESVDRYLDGDAGGFRALQLSRRIADAFDQYTLYRPEMVLEWEAGAGGDWQAELWRDLVSGCDQKHRAACRREVLERLESGRAGGFDLPRRISIFGIPVLPPFHLDILYALARHVRVCLFLLNPCREYWGDIVTRRRQHRERARAAERRGAAGEDYLEVGNPLLSSMGGQGRQFQNLLLDKEEAVESSDFRDPGEGSLLACIQSDILTLTDRGRDRAQTLLRAEDESIRIHSLHSPMREMEALHDSLLSLFEAIPGLEPRDIVVMTPQIETYAPFITAVFGAPDDPELRIPFSIADRSRWAESPVIQAFFKLLRLCRGRLGATEVMDLLDSPPVRARFDLAPDDIETIEGWLDDTGIRWGIDGADRSRFGLPPFEENSWRKGFERLLIGYALPSGGDRFFAGILPCDVEGSEGQVLGRCAQFAFALFESVRGLETARPPGEWKEALPALFDRFILAGEDEEREAQAVRTELHEFAATAEAAGFDSPLEIEAVRCWLEEKLQARGLSHGFPGGGVTFCEMLPMRSIPFRVVALVGMDSTAFPRQARPPGFDLIARNPRPGDRSLREEDRHLFLEALLSARDRLYISYVGQSIADNSEIPPSPLVSELLDSIEQGFAPEPPARSIEELILVRHRLQAFSPDYYKGERKLFSYSRDNLEALLARSEGAADPAPFLRSPVSGPSEEWRSVPVEELKRFFTRPVEYFLTRRLGIRLPEEDGRREDCEPFALDALARYLLEQEISERLLRGADIEVLEEVVRSRGVLPPGQTGRVLYGLSMQAATDFVRLVRRHLDGAPVERREVDLEIGAFRVSGLVEGRSGTLLRGRCTKIKPKDQITAWIDHLLWNATEEEAPARTLLIGKGRSFQFRPARDSAGCLAGLLELYWAGLTKPLHFFPAASLAFAEAIRGGKDRQDALEAARKAWQSSPPYRRGEEDDLYLRLAFRHEEALEERFEMLAEAIFGPLLSHREGLR